MKRVLVTAAVLALAAPAAASAKEITSVEVCGAAGCETTRSAAVMRGLEQGGPPTVGPERGPFYRLEITMAHDGEEMPSWTVEYVAGQRQLRGQDGTWALLPVETARAIDRAARSVEPFPASQLRDVEPTVNVDEVVDPPAQGAPAAAADDGGIPWAVPTALVAALLGALGLLERRRRPRLGGPAPAA